jgi:two-component system LytT family response regulator
MPDVTDPTCGAVVTALVVDDEPPARASLRVLLARDPGVRIVGECGCGADALEALRTHRPDVVFLDVQMPEMDGFDVLEQLGTAAPAAIVFVTAFDHYALRAFEAGALDYLLKPFDDVRFAQALARAKERVALAAAAGRAARRIAVRNGRQVAFVALAEIDWIEAADYCVALHVGARTHLLRRSMAAVEEEFAAAGFCRIHRSAIVNLARVAGLETGADGEAEILLAGGARLPLSRRYRAELVQRLDPLHSSR